MPPPPSPGTRSPGSHVPQAPIKVSSEGLPLLMSCAGHWLHARGAPGWGSGRRSGLGWGDLGLLRRRGPRDSPCFCLPAEWSSVTHPTKEKHLVVGKSPPGQSLLTARRTGTEQAGRPGSGQELGRGWVRGCWRPARGFLSPGQRPWGWQPREVHGWCLARFGHLWGLDVRHVPSACHEKGQHGAWGPGAEGSEGQALQLWGTRGAGVAGPRGLARNF